MSLVVVGSIAFDSIKTPFGEVDEALGGSATYFSTSASYYTDVSLVAVVGEDFPESELEELSGRGVDLAGLQRVPGKTFRWAGEYGFDLNEAKTLDTQLNVFETFQPELPASYRAAEFVFLANIHPALQLHVVKQIDKPKLVAADTMNLWIETERETLVELLGNIDMLFVNDTEARMLSGESNIVQAARKIQAAGPRLVAIKRGEYGALLFIEDQVFFVPAYPLEAVFDPTGAGDSFAGGFMGWLSRIGRADATTLRQSAVIGSVMASYVVEQFSLDRLRSLNADLIDQRYRQFEALMEFAPLTPLAD